MRCQQRKVTLPAILQVKQAEGCISDLACLGRPGLLPLRKEDGVPGQPELEPLEQGTAELWLSMSPEDCLPCALDDLHVGCLQAWTHTGQIPGGIPPAGPDPKPPLSKPVTHRLANPAG